MDIDEALDFLTRNHRAVLVTRKKDGSPQISPVACGVIDGKVMVSSREPAYKVRNLRRDPRAALCGFTDGFFGKWVVVEGEAEIVSLPEAMDLLVDLYRSSAGEHPDWDDYRAAMVRERRVIIALTPSAAGPERAG